MLRWFKKFLKSDNAVIELIQFLVIWALWGVVAFVFPIGIIAKFVSLVPVRRIACDRHKHSPLICMAFWVAANMGAA